MVRLTFDRFVMAKTIRAVRRFTGLTQDEIAARMNMPPRSYQHLEGAGRKEFDLAVMFDVAEASGADPFGMLFATILKQPEIAVRMADNKLAACFAIALADFNDVVGDEAVNLQGAEIVEVFRTAFKNLARKAGRPYPEA